MNRDAVVYAHVGLFKQDVQLAVQNPVSYTHLPYCSLGTRWRESRTGCPAFLSKFIAIEGIAAAKLRGVKFGRPRKDVPERFWQLKEDWEDQKITSREAAQQLSIAQDTFLRWVHGK